MGALSGYGSDLLEHHAQLLVASAIDSEVAVERGYRSATKAGELGELGFERWQCRVPALVIPIHTVEGTLAFCQARPDKPRLTTKGKAIRYETPAGVRMRLDVPPRVRSNLGDPSRQLLVTEGARKVDAALSAGVDAIGVLGVWNWRGTNLMAGKMALGDWEAIALNGRTVYLAFDSDVTEKREVRWALRRLHLFLESRDARVRVLRLPAGREGGKVGVDDFLAEGNALDDLFACAGVGPLALDDPDIRLSDLGNARRLVAAHGHELRHVVRTGTWFVWDGGRWRRDEKGQVIRLAKQLTDELLSQAARLGGEAGSGLAKHALRSQSRNQLEAMVRLAGSEEAVALRAEELDADPWLLCCANGTLDLRSGELHQPDPDELLTLGTEIPFDPAATCPRWRFLDEVFEGDPDTIGFLQRAVGYSLTGDTSEQVIFVACGGGSNGKSTLMQILGQLAGDHARTTPFSSFSSLKEDRSPRSDIARLHRARLVVAAESNRRRSLDLALLKMLTGGDRVAARFLYQDFFEFVPGFKIWILTNHKPRIDGDDTAAWRRIRLIPFTVSFQGREDHQLAAKLHQELPGILAWAVRGCLDWQTNGLGESSTVLKATADYRSEEDTVGRFLEERCELGTMSKTETSRVREAYERFCAEEGETPLDARTLGRDLTRRGHPREKSGGLRVYRGIALSDAEIAHGE